MYELPIISEEDLNQGIFNKYKWFPQASGNHIPGEVAEALEVKWGNRIAVSSAKSAKIDHKKWAKQILLYLIDHVRDFKGGDKFIAYSELAAAIGYPEPYTGSNFGKRIGETLGAMGHMFDDTVIDGQTVPFIQALVVSKQDHLPSHGLKEFYPDYSSLSKDKKRDYVKSEIIKVFDFGNRWEQLLLDLKIKTEPPDKPKPSKKKYNPWGSEGSPEHVALCKFVKENPIIVGVENPLKRHTEYPLKSGDKVDVVFFTDEEAIGVEVKSLRSGTDDIERGLYQCVKYDAVLNAENQVNSPTTKLAVQLN